MGVEGHHRGARAAVYHGAREREEAQDVGAPPRPRAQKLTPRKEGEEGTTPPPKQAKGKGESWGSCSQATPRGRA